MGRQKIFAAGATIGNTSNRQRAKSVVISFRIFLPPSPYQPISRVLFGSNINLVNKFWKNGCDKKLGGGDKKEDKKRLSGLQLLFFFFGQPLIFRRIVLIGFISGNGNALILILTLLEGDRETFFSVFGYTFATTKYNFSKLKGLVFLGRG